MPPPTGSPDPARAAPRFPTVAILGGAGYVGCVLADALLARGHTVRVLDILWYGREPLRALAAHPRLSLHALDLAHAAALHEALAGADALVHLACVSNDPSYDLDPGFGRQTNRLAFPAALDAAARAGVRRFIFASSSAVYGTRSEPRITEDTPVAPMTGYAEDKLACENLLLAHPSAMERIVVRPATVCGHSPRMRFDLIVNALCIRALAERRIRILGGDQTRPNVHIADMAAAYAALLEAAPAAVDRAVFNVGCENASVLELGRRVQQCYADLHVSLDIVPQPDARSYRVDAERIRRTLGFVPRHGIADAAADIRAAFEAGAYQQPLANPHYHNVLRMREVLAASAGEHAHRHRP